MNAPLSRSAARWLGLLVILGLVVPAVLQMVPTIGQPRIGPESIGRHLAKGAALIDLGASTVPLPKAVRLSAAEVLSIRSTANLPPELAGRDLIVAGDAGVQPAQVVAHLRGLGISAYWLEGGVEGWRCAAAFLPADSTPFPKAAIQEPAWKQALVLLSGLLVKPLYMLMAGVLAWRLRRSTRPGIVWIRRGLWLFLAGEIACAINLVAFHEASVAMDYLHGWGMALGVSAVAWAGLSSIACPPQDGLPCRFEDACSPCTRQDRCRALRFLPILPLLVLFTACLPLTAGLATIATTTTLAGRPYAYRHELPQVLIELRILPICALLFAGLGFLAALRSRLVFALACTALAIGPLSFSLLRLLLGTAWQHDPTWFLAWEELGELAALVAAWWWFRVFPEPSRSG